MFCGTVARQSSEAAKKIGRVIRAHRDAAQLTQNQLANLADVDASGLQSWEAGRALPGVPSLVKLADKLGIDPGVLITDIRVDDLPENDGPDRRREAAMRRRAS